MWLSCGSAKSSLSFVSETGWAAASCQPGDVLIFHCLTPHAALPNTGSALPISGDFRWQIPDHPARPS